MAGSQVEVGNWKMGGKRWQKPHVCILDLRGKLDDKLFYGRYGGSKVQKMNDVKSDAENDWKSRVGTQ